MQKPIVRFLKSSMKQWSVHVWEMTRTEEQTSLGCPIWSSTDGPAQASWHNGVQASIGLL